MMLFKSDDLQSSFGLFAVQGRLRPLFLMSRCLIEENSWFMSLCLARISVFIGTKKSLDIKIVIFFKFALEMVFSAPIYWAYEKQTSLFSL